MSSRSPGCDIYEWPSALASVSRLSTEGDVDIQYHVPVERQSSLTVLSSGESSFFKSRVLYAVLPVLPLPASLSFNTVRTLRVNSMGRNGFSR